MSSLELMLRELRLGTVVRHAQEVACSTSTILAGQRQLFWPVGLDPS
jgi:hypothetical protein